MNAVTGTVQSVTIYPGRTDILQVEFTPEEADTYEGRSSFSMNEDAAVTVDGKPVTVAELFDWLASHNVKVTIHPCAERYGVSLKTEFTTAPKPTGKP